MEFYWDRMEQENKWFEECKEEIFSNPPENPPKKNSSCDTEIPF